ncbi:MAG: DUF4928 family protein [Verrucomicrobiota bacterium]
MGTTKKQLEILCKSHPKFLNKGGLCVALVVTETAKQQGLPIEPESLRTEEGGQVVGLGKAAVQKILGDHGIEKILAEEGGRTSRGSLGLMEAYVKTLNSLKAQGQADLDEALAWWIEKVKSYFATEGPKFNFDPGKSLQANIEELLGQAAAVQASGGGTNYVGAMLQHLVGAKLDFVLGKGKVDHHGFSVSDQSTKRNSDFEVAGVAIHVTTHPAEALLRKCNDNIQAGLKPLIITLKDGVDGVTYLLKKSPLVNRVDVLDAAQFLTANVYERSFFQAANCKITLNTLLEGYNAIVEKCETDPSLKIRLAEK